MTEQLSDLERLQRLRDAGTVDDAEFAREKARVPKSTAGRGDRSVWLVPGMALALIGAIGTLIWASGVVRPAVQPSRTLKQRSSAATTAAITPEERLAAAQRAAFPSGLGSASPEGSSTIHQPGLLVDTPFGPVLVNEGRVPNAAHVESGSVAVHYLVPQAGGFRVAMAFPAAIETGSFGQLSEMAVSRRFSALPVIYAQGGGMWQGYGCSWTTLTELQPSGPVELVTFMDGYDDTGPVEDKGESSNISGKIANIVSGKSFTVHFTGSRTFDAKYVRVGNTYKLQGGDKNALSGC